MRYLKIRFAAWRERVWQDAQRRAVKDGLHAKAKVAYWKRVLERLAGHP